MMDLFSASNEKLAGTPLAEELRPTRLEDFFGQKKAIGSGSLLRSLIDKGQLPSLIIWGPPGTGKTTFAHLLSRLIQAEFVSVNAVESGAKALKEIGEAARSRRQIENQKTILFVDEIHRFNKAQQDVLLPFVEKGDLILVGATTENPSYEINKALLSRTRLVVFERLSNSDIEEIGKIALEKLNLKKESFFSQETWDFLIHWADGDARRYLNALDLLFKSQSPALKIEDLQDCLGSLGVAYDKNSDSHYDTISAFIKSIRGSDADAGLYYLARMLKGGEDPVFIARRLVILASEDVGNADPRALQVAVSGAQAVEMIGLPEAAINLAQVVTYLASAPKSNRSYMGLKKAQAFIDQTGNQPIPFHLRSAQTELMKSLGYGKGYKYSHDFPRAYVEQNFWPEDVKAQSFYEPADRGFEKQILEYKKWLQGK